jgi:hypothetical protein
MINTAIAFAQVLTSTKDKISYVMYSVSYFIFFVENSHDMPLILNSKIDIPIATQSTDDSCKTKFTRQ